MLRRAAILYLAFSSSAVAAELSDAFGGPVFGVEWGAELDVVRSVHPKGKKFDSFGVVRYEVRDGRTLFDIERREKDKITFAFDAEGRLTAIGANFKFSTETYGELLTKLKTLFGEYLVVDNESGANIVRWEDESVVLSLAHVPGALSSGNISVTIEYSGLEIPQTSAEDLGF